MHQSEKMYFLRKIGAPALMGCLLLVSGCATQPETKPAEEARPVASPPGAGEQFAAPKALPAGPKAIADYGGELAEAGAVEGAKAAPGRIEKADLARFVAEGPGYALTLVHVRPAFVAGRFEGFEVVGFSEQGARSMGRVLERGDVIVRVNNRPIARPEDYMAAWESLKGCVELSVQLIRKGERQMITLPVEERQALHKP